MKLAKGVLLSSLITLSFISYGQNSVGIGVANPNKNAVLELISPGNNQGLLIPKLTTAQRTANSFVNGLTNKESGLLVFDSDENKFYYWDLTAWKEMGTGSAVPQDLNLTGNTLTITNNPSATPIDLTPFAGTNTDDQTLSLNIISSDLSVSRLTGGPSTVNLAPVNTDDQTLTYTGATGVLQISRKTGGPQSVTITSAGTASGDLTGSYPSPTVANNAITSAKILDGTIASADILDATIASADIADGTVASIDVLDNTIATNDILDGTIASVDIADNTVASTDILDNTITTTDILDGTVASVDIATGGVQSVDILDQTVATIDIADNAVTTTQILDSTIGTADIATDGVASVDILDATIVDADVAAAAAINVSKLSIGSAGQFLSTNGTTNQWITPGAFTALINNAGTRNLFGGNPVGSTLGTVNGDNTFFGWNAGAVNTNNSWNVAIGSQAGQNNTLGSLNVLVGWRAGFATTTNTFNGNTFIGAQAGQASTGGPNTFIGEKAGQTNTTSAENVFVGNQTGLTNTTTGGRHTLIGYQSDVGSAGLLNSVAIGFQAVVNASNKIRLGNAAITVIEGQVGFTAASDRRLKTNIVPIAYGLDFIMKLKPMSYNMKNSSDPRSNWGFIAQDIESLLGNTNAVLTVGGDSDRTLGLRYSDFVAPLVKAVQEQQDQIEDLNNKLSESEKKYDALAAELEQIKKAIGLKASNK